VCLKKLPNTTTRGLIKCWILFSRALRVMKSKSTTVKLSFGLCGCREGEVEEYSCEHNFLSKPVVNLSMNISLCPPHKSSQFFCRVFIFSHGNDLSGSQFRKKSGIFFHFLGSQFREKFGIKEIGVCAYFYLSE